MVVLLLQQVAAELPTAAMARGRMGNRLHVLNAGEYGVRCSAVITVTHVSVHMYVNL